MKPYNDAKYKLNGEEKKELSPEEVDNNLYGLYVRGCEMNGEEPIPR